jgi:hypothetical protein
MGGKWTPERRARHAEKMRAWHASLSEAEKADRAAKIGTALKGQVRTEEQRRRNSEAQKGKTLSEDHKAKVSRGLKRSYSEGRREPVRSSHRKGSKHTPEARRKMSEALQGREAWNKGLKTGPRPPEVRQKISEAQTGAPFRVPSERYDAWRAAISETKQGSKASEETRRKMSEAQKRSWASGEREVPSRSGYGIGSYYDTPLQGRCWLRSTSEVQRAQELDEAGVPYLYEAKRYQVQLGDGTPSTYRPDFWLLPDYEGGPIEDPVAFLESYSGRVVIEDVKGWWGPRHKTYRKIEAFQEQRPDLDFRIVVRGGLAS